MTKSMLGKRAVGCVAYLRQARTEVPMWNERTPLVIERITWNSERGYRQYWCSDKFRNVIGLHDYELQDPFGYYEDADLPRPLVNSEGQRVFPNG